VLHDKKISPPPASSHYLSRDDTPDLATGYALLLLFKEATPQVTPQLKGRITSVEARLSPEKKPPPTSYVRRGALWQSASPHSPHSPAAAFPPSPNY